MPDAAVTGTTASALLLDDTALASLARTTLAAADVATLVGPVPRTVTVRDRDGEPEVADLPGDLAETVDRGRRTTLVVSPRLDDGVWLVLDGRLVSRDDAVVLAVEAVWVGCPHGHGHARPLDLDAYATATPDLLRAAMPRVVAHANREHGPELRALAGRRRGVAADDVIAAELRDLDATGVGLRVLDLDGVTDLRLPFARTATAKGELMGLLKAVLTS